MPLELALVMITTLELLKMVLVAPMKVHMDSLIKVKSWLGGSLLKILHQLNSLQIKYLSNYKSYNYLL
jgi:hypothetical protein